MSLSASCLDLHYLNILHVPEHNLIIKEPTWQVFVRVYICICLLSQSKTHCWNTPSWPVFVRVCMCICLLPKSKTYCWNTPSRPVFVLVCIHILVYSTPCCLNIVACNNCLSAFFPFHSRTKANWPNKLGAKDKYNIIDFSQVSLRFAYRYVLAI